MAGRAGPATRAYLMLFDTEGRPPLAGYAAREDRLHRSPKRRRALARTEQAPALAIAVEQRSFPAAAAAASRLEQQCACGDCSAQGAVALNRLDAVRKPRSIESAGASVCRDEGSSYGSDGTVLKIPSNGPGAPPPLMPGVPNLFSRYASPENRYRGLRS
jgi:hypothetical protein